MSNTFSDKFVADEKNLALLNETMWDQTEYVKPRNWHRILQLLMT